MNFLNQNPVDIPSNKKNNFIFIINENESSINILYNHDFSFNDELFYINFFLILKTYIYDKDIIIRDIFSIFENNENLDNKKIIFLERISLKKIEYMEYIDFRFFIEKQYEYDWKYIKNFESYGIKIMIYKNSPGWKNKKIYPVYPWNKNLKKMLLGDSYSILDKNKTLIKKIKHKNLEIMRLKSLLFSKQKKYSLTKK